MIYETVLMREGEKAGKKQPGSRPHNKQDVMRRGTLKMEGNGVALWSKCSAADRALILADADRSYKCPGKGQVTQRSRRSKGGKGNSEDAEVTCSWMNLYLSRKTIRRAP